MATLLEVGTDLYRPFTRAMPARALQGLRPRRSDAMKKFEIKKLTVSKETLCRLGKWEPPAPVTRPNSGVICC